MISMNKYTIKDFLIIYKACINCKIQNIFYFIQIDLSDPLFQPKRIKPTISSTISLPLQTSYSNSSILHIDPTSNSWQISKSAQKSIKFDPKFKFFERSFYIQAACPSCESRINSSILEFTKKHINPISPLTEALKLNSPNKTYFITSNFPTQESKIQIFTNQINNFKQSFLYSFSYDSDPLSISWREYYAFKSEPRTSLSLSLLSIPLLKTKEQFIKKIDLYEFFE